MFKVIMALAVFLLIFNASLPYLQPMPRELGLTAGRFSKCPSSPNCVSSQAEDKEHHVDPLHYPAQLNGIESIKHVISLFSYTKIIQEDGNYLHATFTSSLWGFIDDVEFYIHPQHGLIDVRSASRLGHYDFGANRKRVEKLQKHLLELGE